MTKYILINVFIFISFIYFLTKLKRGIHILQLESYMNDRYKNWMKANKREIFKVRELVLFLFTFTMIISFKWGLLVLILDILILYLGRNFYEEKKPLVITKRVKRLYATGIIIFCALAILANIYIIEITAIVSISIISLIITLSSYFVIILNTINNPIEKAINNSFYNKAKRKLKETPDLKVIGITGSYGKTSTKYIVSTILKSKYNVLMTPESYNTTMGVVRTINEKLKATHQLFVCEMGARNIGDIKEICDLVNPDYAILTAIGPQHLNTFKTLDNIKKTKMELVDSLSDEGVAFVNYSDENIKSIDIAKKYIKYGNNEECDIYAYNINVIETGSTFDVHIKDREITNVKTKLLGEHNIVNIVGAVAIAVELGLSDKEIKEGVRHIQPVPHRLEMKRNPNGSIIIDDAYNSNVKGAKMAVDVLGRFKNRNRILVTPGIVDLGDKSMEYNKEFGKQAAINCDFAILVGKKQAGPICEGLIGGGLQKEKIYIAEDLQDGLKKMNQIMTPDSVVLLENDLPDNYL